MAKKWSAARTLGQFSAKVPAASKQSDRGSDVTPHGGESRMSAVAGGARAGEWLVTRQATWADGCVGGGDCGCVCMCVLATVDSTSGGMWFAGADCVRGPAKLHQKGASSVGFASPRSLAQTERLERPIRPPLIARHFSTHNPRPPSLRLSTLPEPPLDLPPIEP